MVSDAVQAPGMRQMLCAAQAALHGALEVHKVFRTQQQYDSMCSLKDACRAAHVQLSEWCGPQGDLPGSWGVRITQKPDWPRRKPTHMCTDPHMMHCS